MTSRCLSLGCPTQKTTDLSTSVPRQAGAGEMTIHFLLQVFVFVEGGCVAGYDLLKYFRNYRGPVSIFTNGVREEYGLDAGVPSKNTCT